MAKRILFYISFFLSCQVMAQTDVLPVCHFMKDTTQRLLIQARGNYFFASDAITNQFASDYYRGIFLTDETKDHVTSNLSGKNIFAGEANWDLSVTFHPDSSNRNVEAFIAFRSLSHADARFPRDFFELFFRGNKMFAGQTTDLGDFFFQQYSVRQLVFGIGNKFNISPGRRLYLGADLAINNGISFFKVEGRSSSLYTDPGGEFIDADLHAVLMTDDSAAQHPSKLDGNGYSGDVYLEYETEKSTLSFSVENFGSVHWNKWSTRVSLDSTFHFDGIDIRDIFEVGDSIKVTDVSLDSVFYRNYVQNKTEERITTRLPMKISGLYTFVVMENKLSASVGIDLLLNTYSAMRYLGGLNWKLNRSDEIGFVAAAGGYTPFHAGLRIMHLFPWHLKIEIGSAYLYPMVNFKTGKSQGAYLSLSKSF